MICWWFGSQRLGDILVIMVVVIIGTTSSSSSSSSSSSTATSSPRPHDDVWVCWKMRDTEYDDSAVGSVAYPICWTHSISIIHCLTTFFDCHHSHPRQHVPVARWVRIGRPQLSRLGCLCLCPPRIGVKIAAILGGNLMIPSQGRNVWAMIFKHPKPKHSKTQAFNRTSGKPNVINHPQVITIKWLHKASPNRSLWGPWNVTTQ